MRPRLSHLDLIFTVIVHPAKIPGQARDRYRRTAVARIHPALAAFFGCSYYGALRPEEAIVSRLADCHLARHGLGALTLTWAAPRTAPPRHGPAPGSSYGQRDLKHRPESPSCPSGSPCSITTSTHAQVEQDH
jgi:hypothetical protein